MSTNLIRIIIPKKINPQNLQSKPQDQVAQTYKKEVKKFLPPNSKSLKMDLKFKSRLGRENIENDKNIANVNKNDVSKKLNFDKNIQITSKNVNFQKIPNGKFINIKDSSKKSTVKMDSNLSKKDIEMKNQTMDSIILDDDKLKGKMDLDKKSLFETNNSFSLRNNFNSLINESKNSNTIENELFIDEENSIDIDEFMTNAGKKLEETLKFKTIEKIPTESINETNLKINYNNKPDFQSEEYRNLVSQLLKRDYSSVIVKNLIKDEEVLEDCLLNHKITERMRTRMIDWMIEVLSNYKCDDHTFFLAVSLMDRFFKHSVKPATPNDLHLVGITAMFMASKYYDVYPLRLKIVYEKIAHKKISCEEIKSQETEIAETLDYVIGKPTSWEFVNFYVEELFYIRENNFNLKSKVLSDYLENKLEDQESNADYPVDLYTTNMIKLLRLVVVYLAKMNCHDYNLVGKKASLIAASTVFVALKICEQINKESYVNDYFYRKITEISKKSQSEIIKCAQKILYNAQNFDSIFSGLDNLKKVHFNSIIEVKETK